MTSTTKHDSEFPVYQPQFTSFSREPKRQAERVPCAVEDHLDVDAPISGQRFACMSFLSPESAIKRKEAFFYERFVADRCAKLSEMVEELSSMGPECAHIAKAFRERHSGWFDPSKTAYELDAFTSANFEALNREYLELNSFQTSMRGFKVRGCYDTEKEARDRAQAIRVVDPNFDVFVAMVGAWCPWDPSEEALDNVEYQETELNTLMKHYRENQEAKAKAYADDTATKVAAAVAEGRQAHPLEDVKVDAAVGESSNVPHEMFK